MKRKKRKKKQCHVHVGISLPEATWLFHRDGQDITMQDLSDDTLGRLTAIFKRLAAEGDFERIDRLDVGADGAEDEAVTLPTDTPTFDEDDDEEYTHPLSIDERLNRLEKMLWLREKALVKGGQG